MQNLKELALHNIDLRGGIVTYNDFDIDPAVSFETQQWSFKEDLLQIEFDNNFLVDIGFYPEFNPQGSFWVEVIKNENWDDPVFKKTSKTFNITKKNLQRAINFVYHKINHGSQRKVFYAKK